MTDKTGSRSRRAKPETPKAPRVLRREKSAKTTATVTGSAAQAPAGAPPQKAPGGKLGLVVSMLSRPQGATVAQISEATNWLPQSVRGALSGALKKKHGLVIASEPSPAGRIYRLERDAQ